MTGIVLCVLLSQAPTDPMPADPAIAPVENPSEEKRSEEIDKAFQEETPRHVRVTLIDGRVIEGKMLLRDELQMVVVTSGGDPVTIDVDRIKRYEEPLPNRNRSRYFFGSSAMMPEVGQITLSQVELIGTVLEVGVTDNFSFQVGASIPAFFFGSDGINAYAAVKMGASVHKWVHVAFELKLLGLGLFGHLEGHSGAVPAVGLAAVTGTLGSEDLNLSVSVGPPFHLANISNGGDVVGVPLFTVSGFARIGQHVGLMTENWFVPDVVTHADGVARTWFVADTLGARFFGERWAVDLGILLMPSQISQPGALPPVLPWLNFSWHFI